MILQTLFFFVKTNIVTFIKKRTGPHSVVSHQYPNLSMCSCPCTSICFVYVSVNVAVSVDVHVNVSACVDVYVYASVDVRCNALVECLTELCLHAHYLRFCVHAWFGHVVQTQLCPNSFDLDFDKVVSCLIALRLNVSFLILHCQLDWLGFCHRISHRFDTN